MTNRVPSDDAQHIQFEGCDCIVMSPEDYDNLHRQLAACQKECEEQARLNGAGASREAALMARLTEAQQERDAYKRVMNAEDKAIVDDVIRIEKRAEIAEAALQVTQQELDREAYLHKLDHSLADQWQKRAEKAEARNKQLELEIALLHIQNS